MAMFGFTKDDLNNAAVEVWDENAESFELFTQLLTQWRMGFDGPTGLDYTAVLAVINSGEYRNKNELFSDIRVMEHAALEKIAENRASSK